MFNAMFRRSSPAARNAALRLKTLAEANDRRLAQEVAERVEQELSAMNLADLYTVVAGVNRDAMIFSFAGRKIARASTSARGFTIMYDYPTWWGRFNLSNTGDLQDALTGRWK